MKSCRAAPVAFLLLLLLNGCALYNDVSVRPLTLLPSKIDRGSDLASMVRKADYLRALEAGNRIDARNRADSADLASLGKACLATGRLDAARHHLRSALDLNPFRTAYADIAWDLSQVEYLANNYESSLEWAKIANNHGLVIRDWHMEYLKALSNVPVYRFSGAPADTLHFKFGRPDVPRISVNVNGAHETEAVIDSGAVVSIVSDRFARTLDIRRLGTFEGTFQGLLGEPIQVTFGLIDRLEIGKVVLENVPVAIMPDAKMRFLISKKEGREFRIDLLLGTNLLKEFRLDLDFRRNHVTFTRLFEKDRIPAADQNLFYSSFRPHVRSAVNGRAWFLFVLDTGSEITFLNESRLAALPVPFFSGGAHTAMLQGLGGAMKRGGKIENVEVGVDRYAGVFRTLPMYSSDEEGAFGIIGQNFLRNFKVGIDFGRMRVELERR